MSEDPIVQALQPYSSCDVFDALLKLNHRSGGTLIGITLWSPQRQEGPTKIIGPAYTVKYVPKDDTTDPNFQGHYIDTVAANSILFISSPAGTTNGVYGGLMSTRAHHLQVAGTVVDGRIRDLQEHRDLGFPVFARDVGVSSPGGSLRVGEVNTPVRLQSEENDVTIHPGDYIIGDLNGVVCLPKKLAGRVVKIIGGLVEADEGIARDLKRGRGFEEASKEWRGKVRGVENLDLCHWARVSHVLGGEHVESIS